MTSPVEASNGLLITRDLMFTSKVTGTAQQLGYTVQAVPDGQSALARVEGGGIQCVFVDLALPGLNLAEFVQRLPAEGRPAVVAFGSHVATAQLQAARDAGCDEVQPRSRFSAELPTLLQNYLAPAR